MYIKQSINSKFKRGMKASSLQGTDRGHIISLFHKHVCPKHRRDYRDNRRGKIMIAQRSKREKGSVDEDWKKMVMNSKERSLSSSNTSDYASAERLKPPPSCINKERKTIKLGGSNKTSASNMDFIVVKRRSSEDSDQSPENKVRKVSEGEIDSEQNKRKDEEDHKNSKKIRKNTEDEDDETSLENGKKMKHDRKPITWP
ncbi:uncharacterized protein LOC122259239 isoform X2 [Penaeus japonicus]|uniref:uncharacterized protein LOC122259239 isoform X2 n=1 Tax=Penaeus japonicus TaxID=27405 RepID=UPI001C70C941|nr:uncharacterized protein LOC122259239 isoform X2 [Penaeus japonicus]